MRDHHRRIAARGGCGATGGGGLGRSQAGRYRRTPLDLRRTSERCRAAGDGAIHPVCARRTGGHMVAQQSRMGADGICLCAVRTGSGDGEPGLSGTRAGLCSGAVTRGCPVPCREVPWQPDGPDWS